MQLDWMRTRMLCAPTIGAATSTTLTAPPLIITCFILLTFFADVADSPDVAASNLICGDASGPDGHQPRLPQQHRHACASPNKRRPYRGDFADAPFLQCRS